MADYEVRWAPFLTPTSYYGQLPVTEFTWSDTLNSPGSITGKIPLNPYPGYTSPLTSDTFAEGRTVLWVARDGVPVWTGILWGWDVDAGADTFTFTGEGWHSYARKVPLNGGFDATDQATIADYIISRVNNFTDAATDLITASNPVTGVTRDQYWYWWDPPTCGAALEELASQDHGFDFRYRPVDDGTGVWSVVFEIGYPATGDATGLVFDLEANVASLRETSDGKSLATSMDAFGSGSGQEVLVTTSTSGALFDLGYPGLWSKVSYSDVKETAILQAHLTRDLARVSAPIRQLEMEVFSDTAPTLGEYGVGDLVTVRADRGFLQLDDLYRITSRTVSVDPGGNETVQLSLSPAAMFT
jgi:hypothetical protein